MREVLIINRVIERHPIMPLQINTLRLIIQNSSVQTSTSWQAFLSFILESLGISLEIQRSCREATILGT